MGNSVTQAQVQSRGIPDTSLRFRFCNGQMITLYTLN